MTRSEFTKFVESSLEAAVRYAEEYSGQTLPRKIAFRWLAPENQPIEADAVHTIVERVFVDEEHIWPCVDIGVYDLLKDGTVLIGATVAGYPPRPFGKNWSGTDGPFILMVAGPFYERYRPKQNPS